MMTSNIELTNDVSTELQRVNRALQSVFAGTSSSTAGTLAQSPLPTNDHNIDILLDQSREVADQYLQKFQHSTIAWMVCDQILLTSLSNGHQETTQQSTVASSSQQQQQSSSFDIQRRFFAAQTLHAKCRGDVHQLPYDSLPSLRDSLVNHLLKHYGVTDASSFTNTDTSSQQTNIVPHALMIRLALAVAALSVQMCWTSVVRDMLQQYNSHAAAQQQQQSSISNDHYCMALLDLFSVLPEEATNERILLINEHKRDEYRTSLQTSSADVLHFLAHRCQQSLQQQQQKHHPAAAKERTKIFECLMAWLRCLCVPSNVMEQYFYLIQVAFESVIEPLPAAAAPPQAQAAPQAQIQHHHHDNVNVNEAAVDVIVEFIRAFPSYFDKTYSSKHVTLIQRTIPLVMQLQHLEPMYFLQTNSNIMDPRCSLQFTQDDIDDAEYNERLRAICRIIVEMGENYLTFIVGETHSVAGPDNSNGSTTTTDQATKDRAVELMLKCSAIPNRELSSMTLNFWYKFVDLLEHGCCGDVRQQQIWIDHYQPVLVALIKVCVTTTLGKYPTDVLELRDDQLEDIERDRMYVADTIEDCCRLLGGRDVLRYIGELIREECYRLQQQQQSTQQAPSYLGLEACLFALKGISNYVPNDESEVLPFVFADVLTPFANSENHQAQTTGTPLLLRRTIHLLLGQYASWLAKHPHYLQPMLPFLAQGFSFSETKGGEGIVSSAALAVQQLCDYSWDPPLGEPVLQLYEQLVNASTTTGGNSRSNLDLRDELAVLEGVCKAMSHELQMKSPEDCTQMFGRIVSPIGHRLANLLARTTTTTTTGTTTQPFAIKQVVAEIERLTVIVRYLKSPSSGNVVSSSPSSLSSSTSPSRRRTAATGGDTTTPKVSELLIVELMKESWELLDRVTQQHPRDANLAEKVCRLHKHSMRSCGPFVYAPLLPRLMTQLVRNFRHSFFGAYLYASSICVTEYGSIDVTYRTQLYHLMKELSEIFFERMISLEDFTEHPDVVEEYFYLVGRFMTYCPEPLVIGEGQQQNAPPSGGGGSTGSSTADTTSTTGSSISIFRRILQRAVVGMHIHHREAHKGTLTFLETTASFGLNLQKQSQSLPQDVAAASSLSSSTSACQISFQDAIICEGPAIVHSLAHSLLGDLPSYSLDHGSGSIAGVLWKLNLLCPLQVSQWIQPPLMANTSYVPEQSRHDLLSALTTAASPASSISREDFNRVIRHFKTSCDRQRRIVMSMGGSQPGRQA